MGEIQPKGLLLDQEKVTRVDFSLKGGKKYMHCQTEIRYILQKLKLKREKKTKDNTISNL